MATILCVDDSSTMRHLVSSTLVSAGHTVVEAVDGVHALELSSPPARFDLFLCDVNMPRMDGLAFVRRLRATVAWRYTPVLMLTTEFDPKKKQAAREAGATGWLVKPFQPDGLLATIRKALG